MDGDILERDHTPFQAGSVPPTGLESAVEWQFLCLAAPLASVLDIPNPFQNGEKCPLKNATFSMFQAGMRNVRLRSAQAFAFQSSRTSLSRGIAHWDDAPSKSLKHDKSTYSANHDF
jgi:hypothetical protein